jgi:ABC-type Fe3+ transport system permease subunit
MGSKECFVCFCTHRDKNTQNNPQNPYRQKHTKQSPEPIETKTHKIILRTYGFWGLFCVFLSLWVLRIILCVFVSMGSEDYFVCFCLYGFWGLFCVFLSICHRDKNTQHNPQNPYRQKHTKQSPEPKETKTHKIILRTHRDKNTQNNPQNLCLYGFWGLFCVFLSLWVLGIVLCVFVSMGSEDCWTHIDKNTQNNPQNPYRQKHTKQSSEPI